MDGFFKVVLTLGTGVIFASVIYQTVKKDSQGPAVVKDLRGVVTDVVSTIYK